MNARDHCAAIALQPAHQRQIPQRPLPVEMRAENLRGQRLEFRLGSAPQRHLPDVTANVESRIRLPTRQADVEWRKRHPLAVSRNLWKFRFHKIAARFQRQRTLERTDTRDAERLTGPLDI